MNASQHLDRSDAQTDKTVLEYMLVEHPWPWTIQELGRELDDLNDASDAVDRLARAGLVHRLGEFAFPTRVCSRADHLNLGVVTVFKD